MTYTRENLQKMSVKLTITVEPEDFLQPMMRAAEELAKTVKIDGFRQGHVPYDVMKNKVGEMKLLQEALEELVQKSFVEAISTEKLNSVGSPEISIEKIAPENPLVYTALIALMPEVTKLAKIEKIKIKKPEAQGLDKKLEDTLKTLQRMQATETKVDRGAAEPDKIVVDYTMSKGKVPIEGGQAVDHAIYLDETYYIPGFKEQLLGLKTGEKKNFTLKFPENHYQKFLAGADVDYDLTVKDVFAMSFPSLDDAFAKKLGKQTMDEVKDLIRSNIKEEADLEMNRRLEMDLLEKIAAETEFTEIPDLLIKNEVDAMVHELEHSVEQKGIPFAEYLDQMKKTPAQLRTDFESQATTRVKVALVLAKAANEYKVEVSDEELDKELDLLAASYESDAQKAQVYSPRYRDHERIVLRNRKTIAKLKEIASIS